MLAVAAAVAVAVAQRLLRACATVLLPEHITPITTITHPSLLLAAAEAEAGATAPAAETGAALPVTELAAAADAIALTTAEKEKERGK
jgi:hypothetical protein